jgi:hypothetical protein
MMTLIMIVRFVDGVKIIWQVPAGHDTRQCLA